MPASKDSGWRVRFTPVPHRVFHHLRSERLASALTQADIAALFGVRWKSRVVRYERNGILPPLDYALAYEAIYGKPVSTLLRGTYDRIASDVSRRARRLLNDNREANTPRRLRRQRSLERIAAG